MWNKVKKLVIIVLILGMISYPTGIKKVNASDGKHMVSNCSKSNGHPELGDQGNEYLICDWYNKPWNCVLRHPNSNVAKTIAKFAVEAARNDNIGYSNSLSSRMTFWQQLQANNYSPASIRTKCASDCSGSTGSIVRAVGYKLNDSNLKQIEIGGTTYMEADYTNKGFQSLRGAQYTGSYNNLKPGDILLNSSLHACIYVGDPDNVGAGGKTSETTPRTGHTQKEAGETIAAWCIDFYNKHRGQCTYNWDNAVRGPTYRKPVSDSDKSTTYAFDCVGFVSFALHHAVNIGPEYFTCAVVPPQNSPWGTYWQELHPNNEAVSMGSYKGMQISKSQWQPGDVIIMGHHVAIYVGDGKTIGMYRDQYGGLFYGSADADCSSNGGYSGYVARINPTAAKNANFAYLAGSGSGGDGTDVGYPIDDITINLDEQNFDFSGTPKNVTYSGSKKAGEWIFEKISQFIDFIVAIIANGIKMSVLGWMIAIEGTIDGSIKYLEGYN